MSEVINVSGGQAELSSGLSAGGPYTIHGVALSAGDVTRGSSKTLKKWTRDALRDAASTLKDTNLVRDHENDSIDAVLGTVTDAKFKGGNVLFEAELDDKDIAKKIDRGRLDVSARLTHPDEDKLETNDNGETVISKIKRFVNLSLVSEGASPSNWVSSGPAANLSTASLSKEFEETTEMITTTYYDEEENEMKLRRVSEAELEKEEEVISEDIEELRSRYENFKQAGPRWEGPANEVRNELIAELKSEKADTQEELNDLRSYSPDEKEEDLKTTRKVLDAEIEELSA